MLEGKTVLLTGGTGSFGRAFCTRIRDEHPDTVVRVFSRDELKQHEMAGEFGSDQFRFLLGDVRDESRLKRAAQGADVLIHAAALKQVPAAEYNPFEAVRTNVVGAQNVVDVAIDTSITKVVALSTDKAVNPVNLYGATKLCQEKIVVQGNSLRLPLGHLAVRRALRQRRGLARIGGAPVREAARDRCAHHHRRADDPVLDHPAPGRRPGHVRAGRGHRRRGVRAQDPLDARHRPRGAIAPEAEHKIVGIRPGEKLHELLMTADESRHSVDSREALHHPTRSTRGGASSGPLDVDAPRSIPGEFVYSSGTNDWWLDRATN